MYPFPKTVKEAATVLDQDAPGWHNRVDLTTFNIGDVRYCVLTQVYGKYLASLEWLFGYNSEEDDDSIFDPCYECVFEEDSLQNQWIAEIQSRRV